MKIAVLRYRFVGDSILSLPFLAELRAQEPHAAIHLWTGADALDWMRYCPSIDACFELEPRKQGFWHAAMQLRKQGYDRVYVLKRSFSSAVLAWLSGAPERVGFATEGRQWLLTQTHPYRRGEGHEAAYYLSLLGQPVASWPAERIARPTLAWPESLTQSIQERYLQAMGPRPWVFLHPYSTNAPKVWPLDHAQKLVEKLDQAFSPTFVTLGSPADAEANVRLFGDRVRSGRVVNLAGQTSLLESLVLISALDLVVSADSGVMHMAALAGVPQIALFGPTASSQWQPLSSHAQILKTPENLACQPCGLKISCDDRFPCMSGITSETVFEAASRVLS